MKLKKNVDMKQNFINLYREIIAKINYILIVLMLLFVISQRKQFYI